MKKIILSILVVFGIVCFILSIFSIVGIISLIGGLEQWHKEDIVETYKNYWNYSLGNYEVKYEVNDDNGSNGSGGLTTNKWYDYTFTFRDTNNNLRNITISTFNIKDFNDKISGAAAFFLKEDIEELFKNRSFQEIEGIDAWYDTLISCDADRIDKNIDLYDSKKGLKFTELNLNTLSENNINIEIGTTVRLNGGISDYPNLKQKLIDDVKFIFENYEYSNIKFNFTVQPSDDWYRTEYYLSYDGDNYNWSEKYYGKVK